MQPAKWYISFRLKKITAMAGIVILKLLLTAKLPANVNLPRIKTKRVIKNGHSSFPFRRKFPVLQDNNNQASGVFLYQQITSV